MFRVRQECALSPGSDENDILDTSTCTATASASLLGNDVIPNPLVDDVNLDASFDPVVEPS